jgi:hypothetical protein
MNNFGNRPGGRPDNGLQGQHRSAMLSVSTCINTAAEARVLNRFERSSPMAGEAEVKYLDGDFRVVRPGAFVRCAVTGAPIPLEELKYWSVDLQEAYSSPEVVLQRHFPEPSARR